MVRKAVEIVLLSVYWHAVAEAALMKLWYSDEDGNLSECSSHIGTGRDMGSWRESSLGQLLPRLSASNPNIQCYEQEHRVILGGHSWRT